MKTVFKLVLQWWTPGHTHTYQTIAKQMDSQNKYQKYSEQPRRPTTSQTSTQIIKENDKENRINLWLRGMTGRIAYQHKKQDPVRQPQRKE
ncbi:hypothetical protein ElyMa_006924500 [Elysia marginata]|uniref:Secreted protein n=1 Tax=Elysia marginata TaxID=1093978 RepID=A0AAV4JHT7_9GAST|nr:hypothetical protein ElyMa_006924500 [Elysia marginata]